jgi:hypothetical protein
MEKEVCQNGKVWKVQEVKKVLKTITEKTG